MNLSVYVIYDKVSDTFSIPQFYLNDEVAKRTIMVSVSQNPVFNVSPEDFILYKIGEFDQNTAVLDPCTIDPICSFSDFNKKENVDA